MVASVLRQRRNTRAAEPGGLPLLAVVRAMSVPPAVSQALAARVKRGLAWSLVNNLVLRLGGLLVGILLARILSPDVFGVYAVGLTAQTILQTLAELGLSADLIRRGDITRRAPTVATIGLAVSVVLALITCLLAEPIAVLLGDSAGAPVIRVLAITLVLSGVSAVPYAIAQRQFMQKQQFAADAGGLVITTAVTLALVAIGLGAMSLAWSRVAGQIFSTVAQFRFTRTIPRFGFDLAVATSSLRFGMPLAAANLLSWVLLNVDYIIVGNQGRSLALGFYVLAFNLSSWPTAAVGSALRAVAFPAFVELADNPPLLRRAVVAAMELAWVAGLPIGVCLMVLASPFIGVVYGDKWSDSAGPLVGLAAFGVLRVVFDVMASLLIAKGDSPRILLVQALWIVTLAPSIWLGMRWQGIAGVGWAHLIVALVIIYPAYLYAVWRHGFKAWEMTTGAVWPMASAVISAVPTYFLSRSLDNDLMAVLTGGTVGVSLYFALTFRWAKRRLRALKHSAAPAADRGGMAEKDLGIPSSPVPPQDSKTSNRLTSTERSQLA
ncbi:oligosaccharide flippase family protein [Arthrobacter sp.]|uniref:lipopolysaccharide biosynthesis protein n=1 Tax=Arthrobacter sp. TaxID=1667 RepID=UPI00339329FC